MSKRLMVCCLALTTAAAAGAQAPVITEAAKCRQEGNAYQNRKIAEDRTANRPLDVPVLIAESKRITRECANRIQPATVSEMTALSSLYIYTGDTVKARSLMAMAVSQASSETERAEVSLGAIQIENAALDPFSGINQRAEKEVERIDAMSDAVIKQKIRAHQTMLGRYGYADIDDGIRDHARKLLDLAKRAEVTGVLGKIPRARGSTDSVNAAYSVMVGAYSDMARAAGDYLHADSALMILDEGDRAIGTVYPSARETFDRERKMYRLVGTKATPINGQWWVNAPDGSTVNPGSGKVSIVQFTAHWCVPCKMSYPPMKRLMSQFSGKPVESVMATNLYGYIGARQGLTPQQEVEADRDYYKEHHGLPFQIAINPQPARTDTTNADARYAVGGIPEIVIVDRKGIIRATVVGWDKGNEQRFAAFIDKLLKEK